MTHGTRPHPHPIPSQTRPHPHLHFSPISALPFPIPTPVPISIPSHLRSHPHPHPTRPAPHSPSARRGRSIHLSVVPSAAVRPSPLPPSRSLYPSVPPPWILCPSHLLRAPPRTPPNPPAAPPVPPPYLSAVAVRGGPAESGAPLGADRRSAAPREAPGKGRAGSGPNSPPSRPDPFPRPARSPPRPPPPRSTAPGWGRALRSGLRCHGWHGDTRGAGLAWTRLTCARSSRAAGRRRGARCPPYPAIFSGAALIRVTHLFTRAGFLRLEGGWPSPLGCTTPRAPLGPAPLRGHRGAPHRGAAAEPGAARGVTAPLRSRCRAAHGDATAPTTTPPCPRRAPAPSAGTPPWRTRGVLYAHRGATTPIPRLGAAAHGWNRSATPQPPGAEDAGGGGPRWGCRAMLQRRPAGTRGTAGTRNGTAGSTGPARAERRGLRAL